MFEEKACGKGTMLPDRRIFLNLETFIKIHELFRYEVIDVTFTYENEENKDKI